MEMLLLESHLIVSWRVVVCFKVCEHQCSLTVELCYSAALQERVLFDRARVLKEEDVCLSVKDTFEVLLAQGSF